MAGEFADTQSIAKRECCSDRQVRMTLSLAYLSPTIVKAAIKGTLPGGLGVASLAELPADWERQREMISSSLCSHR